MSSQHYMAPIVQYKRFCRKWQVLKVYPNRAMSTDGGGGGGVLNIKSSSYQYWDPHVKDDMFAIHSILIDRILVVSVIGNNIYLSTLVIRCIEV